MRTVIIRKLRNGKTTFRVLTLKSLVSLGNSNCTVLTHKYHLISALISV